MSTVTLRKAGGDAPVNATPKFDKGAYQQPPTGLSKLTASEESFAGALGIDENERDATSLVESYLKENSEKSIAVPEPRLVDERGFGAEDLKLPRLHIINGNGAMAAIWSQGETVYGDDVIFPAPKKDGPKNVLRFIPLHISKQYRLNVDDDEREGGMQAPIFSSKEECLAYDPTGTFVYVDNKPPRFKPSAKCLLILEQPEGVDHPRFTFEANGRLYAPAVYYAGGGAYERFAREIYSVSQYACAQPDGSVVQYQNIWTMEVVKTVLKNGFTVHYPRVKITRDRVEGALLGLCERILGTKLTVEGDE